MTPRWPGMFHGGVALLYLGQLAAGASRQDWRVAVPVGLGLMMAWTMLQRSRREWSGARLPFVLLVQGALAAFVWLLGRWAIGPLVPLDWPLAATAAISAVGIVLARMAWGRTSPAAIETFLDDAVASVTRAAPLPADEEPWPEDPGDDAPGRVIDLDAEPRR